MAPLCPAGLTGGVLWWHHVRRSQIPSLARRSHAARPPDPLHLPHGPVGAACCPPSAWSGRSTTATGRSSTPARAASRCTGYVVDGADAGRGRHARYLRRRGRRSGGVRAPHQRGRRRGRDHPGRAGQRPPRRHLPHHGRGRVRFLRGQGRAHGAQCAEADPALAVVEVWFRRTPSPPLKPCGTSAPGCARSRAPAPRNADTNTDTNTAESEAFTAKNGGVLMVGAASGAGRVPAWASNTPATSPPCATASTRRDTRRRSLRKPPSPRCTWPTPTLTVPPPTRRSGFPRHPRRSEPRQCEPTAM